LLILPQALPARECAQGCPPDLLGNGHCDTACFREECDFDFGDCTLPTFANTASQTFIVNTHHESAEVETVLGAGLNIGGAHTRNLVSSSRPRGSASNSNSGSETYSVVDSTTEAYDGSKLLFAKDSTMQQLQIPAFVDSNLPRYRLLGMKVQSIVYPQY
jgi:hypothetical protein